MNRILGKNRLTAKESKDITGKKVRSKKKKNGVGEGRRKQETDTEDKTGKKVMICVIAKKTAVRPERGAGWEDTRIPVRAKLCCRG